MGPTLRRSVVTLALLSSLVIAAFYPLAIIWIKSRAFFGTFLFGAAYLLGSFFQVIGSIIPYYFLLMVSYLLTLAILVAIARGARQPSALGVPYTTESG